MFHEARETAPVSAGLCGEPGFPDIGRTALVDAETSKFELAFPDPVHEFNAGDGDRGGSEPFQSGRGNFVFLM
ncbi:hypothetical protein IY145_24180 [Methylosinus sp. H3A]|uniref:hypothetical protein n=1 Tax=Methylosinus sp. H3A TaxID=2785786 RepID=UPI0018C34150|nr:hypothetical protein [Methylosinus sp. H3A]MBG0812438.1 hypothetical protein [Methylosinus sp. H3A]